MNYPAKYTDKSGYIIFLLTVLLLLLRLWFSSVAVVQTQLVLGLLLAAAYCVKLYKWTYRFVPSFFYAASAYVFYTVCLSLTLGKQVVFGFGGCGRFGNSLFNLFASIGCSWIVAFVFNPASSIISHALEKSAEKRATDGRRTPIVPMQQRFLTSRYELLDLRINSLFRDVPLFRTLTVRKMLICGYVFVAAILFVLTCFLKEEAFRTFWVTVWSIGVILASIAGATHRLVYFLSSDNPEKLLLFRELKYIARYHRLVNKELQQKKIGDCPKEGQGLPRDSRSGQINNYYQVLGNIYCSLMVCDVDNTELRDQLNKTVELGEWNTKGAGIWHLSELIYAHDEQFNRGCGELPLAEREQRQRMFAGAVRSYVESHLIKNMDSREQEFPYYLGRILVAFHRRFLTRESGRPFTIGIDTVLKDLDEVKQNYILVEYLRIIINHNNWECPYCRFAGQCYSNGKRQSKVDVLASLCASLPADVQKVIQTCWKYYYTDVDVDINMEEWGRSEDAFIVELQREFGGLKGFNEALSTERDKLKPRESSLNKSGAVSGGSGSNSCGGETRERITRETLMNTAVDQLRSALSAANTKT